MKNMDQKKIFSIMSSVYSTLIILFLLLFFLNRNTNSILIDICLIGLLVIAILFTIIIVLNYLSQRK